MEQPINQTEFQGQPAQPEQVQKPPVNTPPPEKPAYAPQQKPVNDAPMSTAQFLGMLVIQIIPILGIIMVFVWAFGSKANKNKRSLARAELLLALILIVLYVGLFIALGAVITSWFNNINPI